MNRKSENGSAILDQGLNLWSRKWKSEPLAGNPPQLLPRQGWKEPIWEREIELFLFKKEKRILNFKREKTDLLPPPTRLPRLPSTLAEDKKKLKIGWKWFETETAAGLETRDGHCCPLCNRPEGGINLNTYFWLLFAFLWNFLFEFLILPWVGDNTQRSANTHWG